MATPLLDQRVQPIRNLLFDPQATNSLIWTTYGGGDGSGTPSTLSRQAGTFTTYTMRATAGSGATSVHAELGFGRNNVWPVAAGGRFTFLAWMRAGSSRSNGYIRWRGSSGQGDFTTTLPVQLTTAWTFVRVRSPALPAGSYSVTYKEAAGSAYASGDFIEATRAMHVRGTYNGEYSDGSTPGWKWESTANGSQSYGYSYALESILGVRPSLWMDGLSINGVGNANPVAGSTFNGWKDRSPYGRDGTTWSATPPAYINGGVQFTTSNATWVGSGVSDTYLNGDRTIFWVGATDSFSGSGNYIVDANGGINRGELRINDSGSVTGITGVSTVDGTMTTNDTYKVVASGFTLSPTLSAKVWINGVDRTSTPANSSNNTGGMNGWTMGARSTRGGQFASVRALGAVIVPRYMADAEVLAATRWLANHHGISV